MLHKTLISGSNSTSNMPLGWHQRSEPTSRLYGPTPAAVWPHRPILHRQNTQQKTLACSCYRILKQTTLDLGQAYIRGLDHVP